MVILRDAVMYVEAGNGELIQLKPSSTVATFKDSDEDAETEKADD